MSYTALAQVRKRVKDRYGKDIGPFQPQLNVSDDKNDLKSAALRFIHNRCEGLNFDVEKEDKEKADGKYLGTSTAPEQIPYNMQMDINRLCLERELERFIDSGSAEDAYNIYYCFLEMFFGHYGKSKKMVELLSEFESNGSSLLMKHRDHYSHSVYVFTLGLALYETNSNYRKAFNKYYDLKDNNNAACVFLKYWGFTSLFHDIGYPFELPFEQVLSYFEVDNGIRGKDSLFIAYRNVEAMTAFSDEEKQHFNDLYGRQFNRADELLAYDIYCKLGKEYDCSYEYLRETIMAKPVSPEGFGYFMDHAYFSAGRLLQELVRSIGLSCIDEKYIDALSAIILHNSLYKFAVSFYKDKDKHKDPLKMSIHPLAYMLMLCDELQCWDRTAYGRNSRRELHPMAVDFDFSNNAINAVYYYDREEKDKIRIFEKEYASWQKDPEGKEMPRLKAYSDMAEKGKRFVSDIEKIVDTSEIPLTVIPDIRKVDYSQKQTFLSSSNFLHLYDFAVALNGRYNYQGRESRIKTERLEKEFEELSLEYQLSNINQAKAFDNYLNEIGCFFTDKRISYPMVQRFSDEQLAVIAPMEHSRWIREHQSMGWTYGEDYEKLADDPKQARALRELFRQHVLAMDPPVTEEQIIEHYNNLSGDDQNKDYEPFNSMLKLIKKFDGLRIYSLKQ